MTKEKLNPDACPIGKMSPKFCTNNHEDRKIAKLLLIQGVLIESYILGDYNL